MFKTVDISKVYDEKLARKYNALVRFANRTKKKTTVTYGAVNFDLEDLAFVEEKVDWLKTKEKIVIKWGEYTTEIEEANEVKIDREFKLICIER